LFNLQFSSSGFTASYYTSDLLSIDQPLNNYLTLFTQNTDPVGAYAGDLGGPGTGVDVPRTDWLGGNRRNAQAELFAR